MSRELDAKVAEKVMGYVWISPHGFKFLAPADWQKDDGFGYTTGRGPHQHVPFYSIEIDSAFAVVERMRERGWSFHISEFGTKGRPWNVAISNRHAPAKTCMDILVYEKHDESLPKAICLACLFALENHANDTAALRAVEGEGGKK